MRRRLPRWVWWAVGACVAAGAPIAWYLISPLFINRVVDEPFPTGGTSPSFPMSQGATIPASMTQQQVEAKMAEASRTDATADEALPAGTGQGTLVARGAFGGADDFHKGQGTAAVYRVGQDLILRFEDFKVTNGPELHVILTRHEAPKKAADLDRGDVEVAKLKGNVGSQNYTLPQGLNLQDYRAVVIYCKPFHVIFATAPLRAGN